MDSKRSQGISKNEWSQAEDLIEIKIPNSLVPCGVLSTTEMGGLDREVTPQGTGFTFAFLLPVGVALAPPWGFHWSGH